MESRIEKCRRMAADANLRAAKTKDAFQQRAFKQAADSWLKSLTMWSEWSGIGHARFLAFVGFEEVTTAHEQAPTFAPLFVITKASLSPLAVDATPCGYFRLQFGCCAR
jgi:hypothetical protein